MINLHLDEEEKAILSQLLENCIADLHSEIADTDNLDFKTMLKGRKAVLVKLFEALQERQTEHNKARIM